MAGTLQIKRGLLADIPTLSEGEPYFATDTQNLYIGQANGTNKLLSNLVLVYVDTELLLAGGNALSISSDPVKNDFGTITATFLNGSIVLNSSAFYVSSVGYVGGVIKNPEDGNLFHLTNYNFANGSITMQFFDYQGNVPSIENAEGGLNITMQLTVYP